VGSTAKPPAHILERLRRLLVTAAVFLQDKCIPKLPTLSNHWLFSLKKQILLF